VRDARYVHCVDSEVGCNLTFLWFRIHFTQTLISCHDWVVSVHLLKWFDEFFKWSIKQLTGRLVLIPSLIRKERFELY
jgi:hypothetical protein